MQHIAAASVAIFAKVKMRVKSILREIVIPLPTEK